MNKEELNELINACENFVLRYLNLSKSGSIPLEQVLRLVKL